MDLMAIDLGTSSVKVTVTDSESGNVLALGKKSYSLYTPRHGWVETNPEIWWDSTVDAIRQCLDHYKKTTEQIASIGFSGQMHGIIPIDKNNAPLYNCIMYSDSRSESILKHFPDDLKHTLEYKSYNPLTSMMSAPKLLWLSLNEKDIWKNTLKWLMPKDYIRMKLTGKISTDISDASGTSMMDYSEYSWISDIEKVGLNLEKFPEIKLSHEVVGEITKKAANLTGLKIGTPVVCGGADMACTALGTGAIKSGVASVTIGSAGHVIISMDDVNHDNVDKFYQMCHAIPGKYYAFGPLTSGGISLSWFRDRLIEVSDNLSYSTINDIANTSTPGSSGLFFLPYLTGIVVPHSDPFARGAFVGLSLKTSTGDMLRSIMEGVGYGLKDILDVMQMSGINVEKCNIADGGSKSDLWCSILASIFNFPESAVMVNKDSAPIGATILAGIGVGIYSDWEQAVNKLNDSISIPVNSALSDYYMNSYKIYKEMYPQLSNIFCKINNLEQFHL